MKNVAVSVIKVVNQELKGEKIPGIQSYHSVEFQEKEMIFWRYFNIGVGQPHRYNKLSVPSSSEIILPFHDTDKLPYSSCEPKMAKRPERQLCTLYYCRESGCSSSFEKEEDFEAHMMFGEHTVVEASTSRDAFRGMFVEKMKAMSEVRSSTSSATKLIPASPNKYMQMLQTEGWAMPV